LHGWSRGKASCPETEQLVRMQVVDSEHPRPNLAQLHHRGFELRQLRAFVAVIEFGSVSAAAKNIRLAQSTVSEALASLERALGMALVRHERGTRRVTLTHAGRILEPYARKVLAAADETFAAMAEASTSARGTVNIIANESISSYILSRVLIPLRETWTNTKFSVTVGTCNDVRKGVSDLRFDFGLFLETTGKRPNRIDTKRAPRQSVERIAIDASVELVIFVTSGHPLVKAKQNLPLNKSVLQCYPVFISDAAGDFHILLERYLQDERVPGPRLESTGSIEGVKAGVANDPRGIGVLPRYAVAEELGIGRFCSLPIKPGLPPMRVVGLLPKPNDPHPSTPQLIGSIQHFLTVRA
jgi:DNA-binding transcriptional LysR family regulator